MNLEEAIKHAKEQTGSEKCRAEHTQLSLWLCELKCLRKRYSEKLKIIKISILSIGVILSILIGICLIIIYFEDKHPTQFECDKALENVGCIEVSVVSTSDNLCGCRWPDGRMMLYRHSIDQKVGRHERTSSTDIARRRGGQSLSL